MLVRLLCEPTECEFVLAGGAGTQTGSNLDTAWTLLAEIMQ